MRLLGLLTFLALILFAVGLYRGWFTVSASQHDGSRPHIDIAMDCEDGAPAGREKEHADMVIAMQPCAQFSPRCRSIFPPLRVDQAWLHACTPAIASFGLLSASNSSDGGS